MNNTTTTTAHEDARAERRRRNAARPAMARPVEAAEFARLIRKMQRNGNAARVPAVFTEAEALGHTVHDVHAALAEEMGA